MSKIVVSNNNGLISFQINEEFEDNQSISLNYIGEGELTDTELKKAELILNRLFGDLGCVPYVEKVVHHVKTIFRKVEEKELSVRTSDIDYEGNQEDTYVAYNDGKLFMYSVQKDSPVGRVGYEYLRNGGIRYNCMDKDMFDMSYDESKDLLEFRRWNWACGKNFSNLENDKLKDSSGTTSDSVNEFIEKGKKNAFEVIKTFGKSNYELTSIPTMPQFRMIRHIVGKSTFNGTENNKNDYQDGVGCFSDFRKSDTRYQLPYSILYNEDFPNILAAGRIISAEGEGWQITRVIPVCALSGQVAGTAAALCAKEKNAVDKLSVNTLQNQLQRDGVKIKF